MGLETPSFELATPIFAGYELKNPGFQVCQPLDQRTEVLDRSNSWLRGVLERSNSPLLDLSRLDVGGVGLALRLVKVTGRSRRKWAKISIGCERVPKYLNF